MIEILIAALAFLAALIGIVFLAALFYVFLGWVISFLWNLIFPENEITLWQGTAIALLASIIGVLL